MAKSKLNNLVTKNYLQDELLVGRVVVKIILFSIFSNNIKTITKIQED